LYRALLAATTALLYGCGGLAEHMERYFEEASVAYNPPEQLNGSPQDTGILLVDALSTRILSNRMGLTGVAIANLKEPEKPIVFGSISSGFLSPPTGVVVIPNLQPGTYKIIKIETANVNYRELLYMPNTKDFEVEIYAGRPTYFGQIQVKRDGSISIQYDKTREAESWGKVVDKYSDSPWVTVINTHVKELR
jgi:hypothetical protein